MKLKDVFKLAIGGLKTRRLRSFLTIIGVVIGVAAVVTLISLAQGIRESISSQLETLGGDTITVIPGFVRALEELQFSSPSEAGGLTGNDVRAIKNIQGVLYVDGVVSRQASVSYQDQAANLEVQGIDAS